MPARVEANIMKRSERAKNNEKGFKRVGNLASMYTGFFRSMAMMAHVMKNETGGWCWR